MSKAYVPKGYIFNNDDDAAIGEVESYNYYAVVIEHTKWYLLS